MAGGRKPKLNEEQLSQAWARHLNGEPLEDIAKDFGTTKGSLSKNFAGRKGELKQIAHNLADAEKQVLALPPHEQVAVRHFANELKEISYHLGSAAKYGAMSAHRLSAIAKGQAERVSDIDPLGESAQELQAFAVLTESANKATYTGINLLKANQEAIQRINKDAETPPESKQVVFQVADGRKVADA